MTQLKWAQLGILYLTILIVGTAAAQDPATPPDPGAVEPPAEPDLGNATDSASGSSGGSSTEDAESPEADDPFVITQQELEAIAPICASEPMQEILESGGYEGANGPWSPRLDPTSSTPSVSNHASNVLPFVGTNVAGFFFLLTGALLLGAFSGYGMRAARSSAPPKLPMQPPPAPLVEFKPEAPAAPGVDELRQRVKDQPANGEAHFELGVALWHAGEASTALAYLERAFRLRPDQVLRVLEDPRFESLRASDDLRRLLRRYQRDQQRTLWTGYV